MTALAKQQSGAITHARAEYFSPQEVATLKNVICPGLTDSELDLVGQVSRQTGLSVFMKQLHVTKRPTWDADQQRMIPKLTIQTGIDGYRLTAERTGRYIGQRPAEWCGPDGVWRDVWLTKQPPAAARVTVLKSGCEPFTTVARWDAYVQTKKGGEPNSMWSKMGAEQLAKCAEALALRKAFPQELAGVYTQEEMGQAENEPVRANVIEAPPRAPQLPAQTRQREESSSGTTPAPLPTRTSKNYAVKEYQNCPFTDLPDAALTAYLEHYGTKLDEPTLQANHRAMCKLHVAAAEAELERRLAEEGQPLAADTTPEAADVPDWDAETGEVLDHPPADDLAPLLEKSIEMARAGVEWGNTNESLGLVGADAPANQSKRTTRKASA